MASQDPPSYDQAVGSARLSQRERNGISAQRRRSSMPPSLSLAFFFKLRVQYANAPDPQLKMSRDLFQMAGCGRLIRRIIISSL